MGHPDLRDMIRRDITSLYEQGRDIHRLYRRSESGGLFLTVLKALTLEHFLGTFTHQLGKRLSTQ